MALTDKNAKITFMLDGYTHATDLLYQTEFSTTGVAASGKYERDYVLKSTDNFKTIDTADLGDISKVIVKVADNKAATLRITVSAVNYDLIVAPFLYYEFNSTFFTSIDSMSIKAEGTEDQEIKVLLYA